MSQLFSKDNKQVFLAPLNLDNPILVQVLGICSALAVTAHFYGTLCNSHYGLQQRHHLSHP